MDSYTYFKIVMKLVGEVEPTGSRDLDAERFDNLHTLIDLTDFLLMKIDEISRYRKRNEISISTIGDTAYQYTKDLYEGYKECFENEGE